MIFIIAERLKECRNLQKTTQKEVAKQVGVTTSSYQKYELSEREPSLDMLIKLADYYNVTTDYLLGRTDNPGTG